MTATTSATSSRGSARVTAGPRPSGTRRPRRTPAPARREALERGADIVIAAGGDGTIRAVAEELGGTSTSLALLPSGTGNLLARNLDLTLDDIEHSVRVAFDGVDRKIDLAWADIRREGGAVERAAYLVMAGFGLDAKMLSNTDEDLKAKVGWLAYVDAIRKALRDKNHMRMRYRLDRRGTHRGLGAHPHHRQLRVAAREHPAAARRRPSTTAGSTPCSCVPRAPGAGCRSS